jgi:hypothetical protein
MISDSDIIRTAIFELIDNGPFRLTVDGTESKEPVLDRSVDGERVLAYLTALPEAFVTARSVRDRIAGYLFCKDGRLNNHTECLNDYIPETLALIETREELEQGRWG